jgi:hemerythrin-like metal-binding protein
LPAVGIRRGTLGGGELRRVVSVIGASFASSGRQCGVWLVGCVGCGLRFGRDGLRCVAVCCRHQRIVRVQWRRVWRLTRLGVRLWVEPDAQHQGVTFMISEFHAKLFDRLVDVGVPTFNMAHERLLNLVVDADVILGASILSNNSLTDDEWNSLSGIFDDLIVYVKIHFNDEVGYLRAHGYPAADQHQSRHDEVIEELNVFQRKVMQNDDANKIEIRRWLLEWLLNHVNNQDHAYALYFAKRSMDAQA